MAKVMWKDKWRYIIEEMGRGQFEWKIIQEFKDSHLNSVLQVPLPRKSLSGKICFESALLPCGFMQRSCPKVAETWGKLPKVYKYQRIVS